MQGCKEHDGGVGQTDVVREWRGEGTDCNTGPTFPRRFGSFPTIEEMLENVRATVVLAFGELTEVSAERILYSAETAHLFEKAQSVGMVAGNAALQSTTVLNLGHQ